MVDHDVVEVHAACRPLFAAVANGKPIARPYDGEHDEDGVPKTPYAQKLKFIARNYPHLLELEEFKID